ncbi:MAG: DUF5320 domain-containing protein [Nanoarchaeota archaeon]|nr:DUF5320 domain-containing protein [Nanoarchaeota archaeon]MBU1854210.1 DUF5320 domain-containing protein [Nanoarchaeota archaeon]
MPAQNKTGPEGKGPMTGRGLGPCNTGQGTRRIYGRGFGRGLGLGRRNMQTPSNQVELTKEEEEKKILEEEKQEVEKELEEINKRIQEIQ